MLNLTVSLPGSPRTLSMLALNAKHAAALIRRFARSRGVSVLAVDWSARRAARRGGA